MSATMAAALLARAWGPSRGGECTPAPHSAGRRPRPTEQAPVPAAGLSPAAVAAASSGARARPLPQLGRCWRVRGRRSRCDPPPGPRPAPAQFLARGGLGAPLLPSQPWD